MKRKVSNKNCFLFLSYLPIKFLFFVLGISSNNNKLDSREVDHSLESLQEIELLQRQLTDMAKEKSELALELGERKGELQILKNEIVKLKVCFF